ncbi:MAG: hypothetical protein AAF074_01400 [Pseudomonadota bacterium]
MFDDIFGPRGPGASEIDGRVNMLVSINPNDHAVIGMRNGTGANGGRFDWYHFTATGPMETQIIGDREFRSQRAVFERHNRFDLTRASGSLFGFHLPPSGLAGLRAFCTSRDGTTGHLRNAHATAWRDPLYVRFNCATAVGYCLRAAGVALEGGNWMNSGAILRLVLRSRAFSNPHWMIWTRES